MHMQMQHQRWQSLVSKLDLTGTEAQELATPPTALSGQKIMLDKLSDNESKMSFGP